MVLDGQFFRTGICAHLFDEGKEDIALGDDLIDAWFLLPKRPVGWVDKLQIEFSHCQGACLGAPRTDCWEAFLDIDVI